MYRLLIQSLSLLLSLLFAYGGGLPREAQLSETILFSIDYPGAGFGTRAMCAGAEVYVHTDGTVRVEMTDSSFTNWVEIGRVQLSPADYAALADSAAPEKIARLSVQEDDGCDGSSYFITLYTDVDGQPQPLLKKGGYMPIGKEFWAMYQSVREQLDKYGVGEMVTAWREGLE